ncbi:hypothetical protein Tco_1114201 [Tanacetum coccineum]|uniref:Uncharacterized protein n=1 Tax=Tanacetum coccineum TaxID=301880 RepID=A0ABQ5IUE4_9ASTR
MYFTKERYFVDWWFGWVSEVEIIEINGKILCAEITATISYWNVLGESHTYLGGATQSRACSHGELEFAAMVWQISLPASMLQGINTNASMAVFSALQAYVVVSAKMFTFCYFVRSFASNDEKCLGARCDSLGTTS